MKWIRTWKLGFKSLVLHPLRSLLTVLGIFIGVASVIWLLAIGEGISAKAQEQIQSLGAENIMLVSRKPPNELTASIQGPLVYGLLRADYARLLETIPTIESALPIRELQRQLEFGGQKGEARMVGCTPEYAAVTRLVVDRGRFLTDIDVAQRKNHCVLAAELAQRLFRYQDPIGRYVQMPEDNDSYVVVGVMKSRSPTAAIGGSMASQDFSSDIYVPISTMRSRIGDYVVSTRGGTFIREEVELNQITLRVNSVDKVIPTAEMVRQSLKNHDALQDVSVVVPLDLLEQAKATRLLFIVLMCLIAAISLVVGGIGIMNIMLATVTERTREIGIRRALGATKGDIIRQFLVETIVLATTGGLSGVLGGVALLPLVGITQTLLMAYAPGLSESLPEVVHTVQPKIVPASIPLAFGISVLVGIVFGIYPAMRAAELDPIEALRHE